MEGSSVPSAAVCAFRRLLEGVNWGSVAPAEDHVKG